MQLVRYNPLRDFLDTDTDVGRWLTRRWDWLPTFTDNVDMYIEKGQLYIKANLPDFKKNEIKVEPTIDGLEISAEHQEVKEEGDKDRQYILKESSETYYRQISLPREANKDELKAVFKDGKLTITMPMTEQPKAKTVKIE